MPDLTAHGPLASLADPPLERFSVAGLASCFTALGLRGRRAGSPWDGTSRVNEQPHLPAGTSTPAQVSRLIERTIERGIGDEGSVAVAANADPLATAALVAAAAAACRRDSRRLVVVGLDLADDRGRRTISLTRALTEALAPSADVVAVPASPRRWGEPAWATPGPRLDAWPRYRRGLAEAAAAAGAGVLLHPDGATRILGAPDNLIGELLRPGRLGDARRWWRDALKTPGYTEAEAALALAGGRLRSRRLAAAYWTVRWPELESDAASALLTPPMAAVANRWNHDFRQSTLTALGRLRPRLAEAILIADVLPHDVPLPAGVLPETWPFLDPAVAGCAYDLPLAARYSAAAPTARLRRNALLAGLVPAAVARVLPQAGPDFARARRRYCVTTAPEPIRCVELGLLRADWRSRCREPRWRELVSSCEVWIRGAERHGASAT